MSLISLLLTIAIIGLVAWLIATFIPMPSQFKLLIIGVAILIAVLYVLGSLGVLNLATFPRLR